MQQEFNLDTSAMTAFVERFNIGALDTADSAKLDDMAETLVSAVATAVAKTSLPL